MTKKRLIIGLLTVVSLLAIIISLITYVERKPPYTESEINEYVQELTPLVEQIAGRRFKTTPSIKLINASQLVEIIRDERRLNQDVLYSDIPKEQRQHRVELESVDVAGTVLGKYGMKTKNLYMIPQNFQPLMERGGIDKKHGRAVVKLLVAHELTHALQDQYVDVAKAIKRTKSIDEHQALTATFEGQAIFVQEGIAKLLNEREAEAQCLLAMTTVKSSNDPDQPRIASNQYNTYIGGLWFVGQQYERGGNDRIWQLLLSPPHKTSMIIRPETYSPTIKSMFDLKSVLDGLEQRFDKRKWEISNREFGEMEMRGYLGKLRMDRQELNRISSDTEQAQFLIAKDKDVSLSIGVFVMKSNSAASKVESAISHLVAMKLKMQPGFEGSTTQAIQGFRQNDMMPKRFSATYTQNGQSIHLTSARLFQGNIMVEVGTYNFDVTNNKIVATANEIFRRIQKEKRLQSFSLKH